MPKIGILVSSKLDETMTLAVEGRQKRRKRRAENNWLGIKIYIYKFSVYLISSIYYKRQHSIYNLSQLTRWFSLDPKLKKTIDMGRGDAQERHIFKFERLNLIYLI